MTATKKSRIQHLLLNPTQKFNIRISKDNAHALMAKLANDCDTQGRSLNNLVEQILLKHYGIK